LAINNSIKQAIDNYDPPAVSIYNTCVPALVGDDIGDPDLTERTEALIAREEARIRKALEPWRERLAGKRVLLFTGGVKSWSVISALQDLGKVVVATGTKKST